MFVVMESLLDRPSGQRLVSRAEGRSHIPRGSPTLGPPETPNEAGQPSTPRLISPYSPSSDIASARTTISRRWNTSSHVAAYIKNNIDVCSTPSRTPPRHLLPFRCSKPAANEKSNVDIVAGFH